MLLLRFLFWQRKFLITRFNAAAGGASVVRGAHITLAVVSMDTMPYKLFWCI